MALAGIHHVALSVPDIVAAESFYCELFDAEVLFREGTFDGEFGAVPEELDWPAARDAGVEPGMSFVARDDVALALAQDPDVPDGGPVDHLAVAVDQSDLGPLCERARALDCEVDRRETVAFVTDHYGIEWELNASDPPPETPFETLDV
ncbi:VOC family protein [Haloarchaeobius sp. TZWWS8]|uniref:VOC family protein n=1 Tax=Haloarchaeobius sp. TZWWS8 TaxID=3446121 RepID=UPI003EC00BE7